LQAELYFFLLGFGSSNLNKKYIVYLTRAIVDVVDIINYDEQFNNNNIIND